METRWATVDGVHLQLPANCTVTELRESLRKPADSVLVAITGDLVAVVHDEERPLSELVAGCAETYYFWRDGELSRDDVLDTPELDAALETDSSKESTFERPGVNP